ncbi:MAG: transcriptional regulator [Eubacteriales bacterium]
MVLSRENYHKIEYYFLNFKKLEILLKEEREDIIFSVPEKDLSGISNKAPGDPTATKACRLDSLYIDKWLKVIKATFDKYKGTPIGTLLCMRYLEDLSWQNTCMELFIEKRTYHTWVNEIIMYAALKACEVGILKID